MKTYITPIPQKPNLTPIGWVRIHNPGEEIEWWVSTDSGMGGFDYHPTYSTPQNTFETHYTYLNGDIKIIRGKTLPIIFAQFYKQFPEETETGLGFIKIQSVVL